MMLSASMLLPQPDSPTTPSASPGAMVSRTSDRMLRARGERDVQPLDREQRHGSDLHARIEHVAQAVAEQIEAEHAEHDREPGEDRDPRRLRA